MGFIRVSQSGQESLINSNLISEIKKGEEKYEFLIRFFSEQNFKIYEVFGDGGLRCEKLLAVKKLTDSREK